MKVLHLSTSDAGGAGRAAYRLNQGLQTIGVASRMLVQSKHSSVTDVSVASGVLGKANAKLKLTERLDTLPLKFYNLRDCEGFSLQWVPNTDLRTVTQSAPDVINLHWLCAGYLSIEAIAQLQKPLVWTLHDMWPFTGGCHYSQECDRYTAACGACPQLQSRGDGDLSRWTWKRKVQAWRSLDLTIITPSLWLAECAKASSLFKGNRIEVIPNSLDTQIYRPITRTIARERLKLPVDKRLVLFGAMNSTSNSRKGFHLLQAVLQQLSQIEWHSQIELVVFGASRAASETHFGFNSHYIGTLNDDISLSLVYAAADVFVAPSIQDNLPNTVMEATACGTPSVAFKIGGMPDLIEHQKTGYLASPFEVEDFAKGIVWVLEYALRHQKLCQYAREKAEQEFSLELQAKRYQSLFRELLSNTTDLEI